MPDGVDVAAWAAELDALLARVAGRFARPEPRRRAAAYVRGLLAPVERKNGWQLAEAAGDPTPDGVQDFLARARWHAGAVRDDLRAYVVEHLGDPGAVLVLDETGFVKKGDKSVGVYRQYSGTAGRIENCQVAVFLGYAGARGHALIDRALYLPEPWAADPARRAAAGVPGAVAFATKPKLGRAMLAAALEAGVPCAWVAADSVYGADSALRRWLEARPLGYVLAVTSGQLLAPGGVRERVDEIADALPADAWQRLSAGDGAKGPRLYDWAYVPYRGAAPGWKHGLLVRRSVPKPDERAYYFTHAPNACALADLVRVAGARWTVEASFEAAKGEVGLDQYEVRGWTAWHRHVTLAMLAHAYLAVVRARAAAAPHADGGRGENRRAARGARRRAPAAHRPGGAPPALAPRVGRRPGTRGRARVVPVAARAPATRPPLPLAATNARR